MVKMWAMMKVRALLPVTLMNGFEQVSKSAVVYETRDTGGESVAYKQATREFPYRRFFQNLFFRYDLGIISQVCDGKVAFYVPAALEEMISLHLPCKVVGIDTKRSLSLAMAMSKKNPYNGLMNYQ